MIVRPCGMTLLFESTLKRRSPSRLVTSRPLEVRGWDGFDRTGRVVVLDVLGWPKGAPRRRAMLFAVSFGGARCFRGLLGLGTI